VEKTRQSRSGKTLNDTGVGGTEGGRRPTGVPPNPQPAGEGISPPPADPNEVLEKPSRRRFTADYKRRILEQAARAQEPGTLGAVLRREGLYSNKRGGKCLNYVGAEGVVISVDSVSSCSNRPLTIY